MRAVAPGGGVGGVAGHGLSGLECVLIEGVLGSSAAARQGRSDQRMLPDERGLMRFI